MVKACVDGGDETRVLLWRTESDVLSIDRLSPEGARSLAAHLSAVSLERALLERQAILLLQQHGAVGEIDQLNAARAWVRAIAAGETPEQMAVTFEATLRALPSASWVDVYGDNEGRHAFERRRTEATVRLASVLLVARTAKWQGDADVVEILADATASWANSMLSAWAARVEEMSE